MLSCKPSFRQGAAALAALSALLLPVLSGCAKESTRQESADAEPKPVIRLAGTDTGTPNPFRHLTRGPGTSKMQLLYDSLLEKDESGDIPWLARSWSVSDDGLSWTFTLVDNAFWHDGQPLTAEDAAFTFEYYRDHPPVSNELIVGGTYLVTKTEVLDAKTFRLTTSGFDNNTLRRLGFARIIPKHVWETVADPVTFTGEGAAVGSGPYRLESYDPAQGTYRYAAFDRYWGLEPAAAAIEWVPVSDSVLAFENGDISLTTLAADVLPRFREKADVTIKTVPSYHSYRLMMNIAASESLADLSVRQAMAYAINRQALVDKVSRGSAAVSSMGYVPDVSPWYNPAVEAYGYDPEKAKALLGGKALAFEMLTGNTPEEVKIAELIKLDLSAVGIDVSLKSVEAKTRDSAVKSGKYVLLLINSGGMGGDPDYLRSVYAGVSNSTALNQSPIPGYSNAELNDLAAKQAVEQNGEERKELIFRMQEIIARDVPMIMLHGALDNFAYRSAQTPYWMGRYDHNKLDHNKLSYLVRN